MFRVTSLLIAALLLAGGGSALAKKKTLKAWGAHRAATVHDMSALLEPGAIAAIREGMHGPEAAAQAMRHMQANGEHPVVREEARGGGEHERGGASARTEARAARGAARVTWHVQPAGGERGGEHEGRAPVRVKVPRGGGRH